VGTEVKSLRAGRADLLGCYAKVEKKGVVLYDATIQVYEKASHETHDPKRPRQLLLNKVEIVRLTEQTLRKGLSLPVLRMYWGKKGGLKLNSASAKANMRLISVMISKRRRNSVKQNENSPALNGEDKNSNFLIAEGWR